VPVYLDKAAADNPDLDSRLLNVFLQFERIRQVRVGVCLWEQLFKCSKHVFEAAGNSWHVLHRLHALAGVL
jgi:hypothetical protein